MGLDGANGNNGVFNTKDEMAIKNAPTAVIHTADDPLLSEKDKEFLSRTLKERMIWFDCGGHLGNMFVKEYQDHLLKLIPPAGKK